MNVRRITTEPHERNPLMLQLAELGSTPLFDFGTDTIDYLSALQAQTPLFEPRINQHMFNAAQRIHNTTRASRRFRENPHQHYYQAATIVIGLIVVGTLTSLIPFWLMCSATLAIHATTVVTTIVPPLLIAEGIHLSGWKNGDNPRSLMK